jgi:hypothetical protein
VGEYDEAEEALLLIQNDKYCADPIYQSWLVRCFIAKGKARMAWERYLRMETSEESFNLLQVRGMCAGCLLPCDAYGITQQLFLPAQVKGQRLLLTLYTLPALIPVPCTRRQAPLQANRGALEDCAEHSAR